MGARSLEALADRLGLPGEITILSLKRLAASAATNRIRILPSPAARETVPGLVVQEDRVALVPAGGDVPSEPTPQA